MKKYILRSSIFILVAISPFIAYKEITGKDPEFHIKDERLNINK